MRRISSIDNLRKRPSKHFNDSVFIRFLMMLGAFSLIFIVVITEHGLRESFAMTILIWSFFVLCTPLAIADFLIDVPLRIFMDIRMIYSHIIIWILAIVTNIVAVNLIPEVYSTNALLFILYTILTNPNPYWGIVILSLVSGSYSLEITDGFFDGIEHLTKMRPHKQLSLVDVLIMFLVTSTTLLLYERMVEEFGLTTLLA